MPAPHLAGVLMLLALAPVAWVVDLLVMGWLTTPVVLVVSFWEGRLLRERRRNDSG
ncbi:hypothetical protein [Stenotrophomonas rhizophila]|uniref:hypothetical protein n=1 Tax=Stenotrophomonas rhizophila TaxID=216778 RepID=UPI001E5838DD|nr:hypothetical protein [Stenotrophomonas rhizophila]MCC7634814.1 hypothetical protein [Stenotrophomonas rhizophila]MCC7664513.1 hypothetical protein [Stenotrophomonas rhizophila]